MKKNITAKTVDERGKTLLLRGQDGEKRIVVPHNAVLTFGPAIPGNDKGDYSRREYALRIYDGPVGKNNLVAVFTGVREFRSIDMPVEKLVIREAGKSVWKSDEEGFKVESETKRKKGWRSDELQLLEEPK